MCALVRLERVLRLTRQAVGLLPDLAILEDGDRTEIGER